MEENIELKRPWTIKWSIGILIALFAVGLIVEISQDGWKVFDILKSMLYLILLFAIWQGKRWARNILFILLFVILPFVVASSGLLVINPTNSGSVIDKFWFGYGLFGIVLTFASIYMMFMKSSNEWFSRIKSEQYQEPLEPTWNFQLTLIGISTGLGFLALAVSLNLLPSPNEIMIKFSTYHSKMGILLAVESFGYLIGVIVTIFPFSLIIGYWKKANLFFITRLITIGAILSMLLFVPGKTLFLFSMFFLSKVLIVGIVAYIGLRFGMVTARYVDTLRVPIKIK